MKRIVSALLACMLLLALIGCTQQNESDDAQSKALVGEYICTSMSAEGLTLDPSAIGLEIYLRLEADGSGTLQYAGQSADEAERLSWTSNGDQLVFHGDRERTATVENGSIVLDDDGAMMIFTKR